MEKRSKRGKQNSRIARLRKRKRKTRRIIILLSVITLLLLSGFMINKVYITNKCTSLEYAVDYYFTNWNDNNLRLSNVKTMSLVTNTDENATVEAYGFSYKEPKQRTTLIGEFVKNKDGSWIMKSVHNKNTLTSNK